MIFIDSENGKGLKMTGTMAEISAECVMALRAIYKKNLEIFPEPEIATGILTNMFIKALDINNKEIEAEKEEEIVLSNDKE